MRRDGKGVISLNGDGYGIWDDNGGRDGWMGVLNTIRYGERRAV